MQRLTRTESSTILIRGAGMWCPPKQIAVCNRCAPADLSLLTISCVSANLVAHTWSILVGVGPSLVLTLIMRNTSCGIIGALLVHCNLQMRLSRRNWEQRKVLKTRENQRVQTGQVGLANRRIQPLCHLSGVYFQQ